MQYVIHFYFQDVPIEVVEVDVEVSFLIVYLLFILFYFWFAWTGLISVALWFMKEHSFLFVVRILETSRMLRLMTLWMVFLQLQYVDIVLQFT